MTTRKEYIMNEDQLNRLLNACKPVPYMIIGGVAPRSPAENANAAWRALGNEMGFVWDTVQPIPGKPQSHFTAMPKE